MRLPTGYDGVTAIASDSAGQDLWVFAQGSDDARLFHWSAATTQWTSYLIPPLGAGEQTPIVLDGSGRAWVGINQTLLIFDPVAGSMSKVSLPPVTVGAAGSGLPTIPAADPGTYVGISSLALGPGGSIVVARDFATELQRVDASTHSITVIPLPADTAIAGLGSTDLASAGDGADIVAALYTAKGLHEVGQYVAGSWSSTTQPCTPDAVTASGSTIAVSGAHCIGTGTASTGRVASTLTSLALSNLPEEPCVTAADAAAVLACVPGGVIIVRNGAPSPVIALGQVRPGPSGGRVVNNDLTWTWPRLLCPTAKGIWFVPRGGGGRIGLITEQST